MSGFIGAGATFSGGQNDEDFNAPAFSDNRYNNTFSTNNGSINYAVVDLGYDVLRTADYKVGPFVGYTVFNQYIFKGGCQQVASTTGNCAVGTATPPLPSSQLIGLEDMTWQALRIGLSAEVRLADRWKLAADAAYLPYVTFNWLDDHLERNLQYQMLGQGIGVQTQAVLSYDVTDRLSVGVGGRYWAMWSTSAQRQGIVIGAAVAESTGPNRNTVDLLGAFAQVSYRFDPDRTIAAKPDGLALPFFKAPVAPCGIQLDGLLWGHRGWRDVWTKQADWPKGGSPHVLTSNSTRFRCGRRLGWRDDRIQFTVRSDIRLRHGRRYVLGGCQRQREPNCAVQDDANGVDE